MKKLLVALLGFVLVVSLLNLAQTYLYDWDEAIYAQVGKEMVASNTPFGMWNGQPWLEKPPLVSLLAGVFMAAAPGADELFARLPSFLAGLGVLYFIFKLFREKFEKNYEMYFLGTTVFLLISPPFLNRLTSLNTDMFLVLGWLGFYYYFKKSTPCTALFLFIGVMSKSFLGFFPIFAVLVEELFAARSVKPLFAHTKTLLLSVGVSIAWFVFAYLKFGQLFIQENFYDHLISRVVRPVELHYGGLFFYPKLLFSYYHVFLVAIILSTLYIVYIIVKKKRFELLFIPLFLVYSIVISIPQTKLNWYMFPIIPFLGMSIGVAFADLGDRLKLSQRTLYIILTGVMLAGIIGNKSYGIKMQKDEPGALTALALVAKKECKSVKVVASNEEQKFYDVINAANVQISSTFRYGGSPAFRFYADQPVVYRYDKSPNKELIDSADCLVLPQDTSFKLTSELWRPVAKKDGFVLYKNN